MERLVHTSIYGLTNTTILPKLTIASLCHTHGHAEVEHSLSKNKKLSTMNVLCCQMRQTTKDAVRVSGYGQAHAMPILDASLQICLQCIQNPKSTRRESEEGKRAETERLPGGRGIHRTKGSRYVYGEKPVSKEQKNARRKWLRGCTVRPSEGYRKP